MPGYTLVTNPSGTIEQSLVPVLALAVAECPGAEEEEGGLILRKGEEFQFVKMRNRHTGERVAKAFIEFDPAEYGQKIIARFNEGWQNYASFHTHPTGCRAYPSMIDLTRLFNGFPVNFIASPSLGELYRYVYLGEKADRVQWEATKLIYPSLSYSA